MKETVIRHRNFALCFCFRKVHELVLVRRTFFRLKVPFCKKPTSSPFLPTTATDPIPFLLIRSLAESSVAFGATKNREAIGRITSRARV